MSTENRRKANWGDDSEPYSLHRDVETMAEPIKPHVRLQVEELIAEPPSYLVTNQHGNQWLVVTASDGVLEIVEESSDAKIDVRHYIVSAVEQYQKRNPKT